MISTFNCGNISKKNIGKTVKINGWVKKNRKLGSLIFMDVYDRYGLVQIVVEEKNKFFKSVLSTTVQSVVSIEGKVRLRSNPNKKIKNGDIEISLSSFEILSNAKQTPIIVDDVTDALEDTRLKYRYLDLRRSPIQELIIKRSQYLHLLRSFLQKNDFIEIETPILSKTTPEGARDYLVPTRNNNLFFALPQSPQIYKQLLMVSGFLKYFQISRCFRDEDLRSDRQPEFTQLDMELSFVSEQDIMSLIESLLTETINKMFSYKIKKPFMKITYDEAVNFYGSDKPDLRFDIKLNEGNNIFKNSKCKIFQNALKDKKVIKYLIIDKEISKPDIEKLRKYAKDNHAFDLIWISYFNNQIGGSIKNIIEPEIVKEIFKTHKIKSGNIFVIADKLKIVNAALGAVRNELGTILNLKDPNNLKFCWVTNFPLFEYSETENRWVSAHHPFTSPTEKCLKTFTTNSETAYARAYDIVLNGYEIGGGSIRITDPNLQEKMFEALKLSKSEINEKFGFILEAFKYGVPPHGGIALGLDRLLMILLQTKTIRDVIAFPKNAHGYDMMMSSPTSVSEKQLNELNLKIKK